MCKMLVRSSRVSLTLHEPTLPERHALKTFLNLCQFLVQKSCLDPHDDHHDDECSGFVVNTSLYMYSCSVTGADELFGNGKYGSYS